MAEGKMTLHDFNSMVYAGAEPLTATELEKFTEAINNFCSDSCNSYYFLLSNELRYYTMFAHEEFFDEESKSLGEEVLECLSYLGSVVDYSIENGSIEIWIKQNGRAVFLMLMPWDSGVVEFR